MPISGYRANCINCGGRKVNKGDYCAQCAVGRQCYGCGQRVYPGQDHGCSMVNYRRACSVCRETFSARSPNHDLCVTCGGYSEKVDGATRIESPYASPTDLPDGFTRHKHIRSVDIQVQTDPVDITTSWDSVRQYTPGVQHYTVVDQDGQDVPQGLYWDVVQIAERAIADKWDWGDTAHEIQQAIDKHNRGPYVSIHQKPEIEYPQEVLW